MKTLQDNCKMGSHVLDKRGALYMHEYGWIGHERKIHFDKMDTLIFRIYMEQGRGKDERN